MDPFVISGENVAGVVMGALLWEVRRWLGSGFVVENGDGYYGDGAHLAVGLPLVDGEVVSGDILVSGVRVDSLGHNACDGLPLLGVQRFASVYLYSGDLMVVHNGVKDFGISGNMPNERFCLGDPDVVGKVCGCIRGYCSSGTGGFRRWYYVANADWHGSGSGSGSGRVRWCDDFIHS